MDNPHREAGWLTAEEEAEMVERINANPYLQPNQEAGAALLERLRNDDDLHSRIEAADTIEALVEALKEYGDHKGGCRLNIRMGLSCQCGWNSTRNALLAKLETGDTQP
jgi:hypothetical protein